MNKRVEKLIRSRAKELGIETVKSNTWAFGVGETSGKWVIMEVWRGAPTRTWTYSIIHEIGHFLIHRKGYRDRYWRSSEVDGDIMDNVSAVEAMREEFEAWDVGYRWAKRIGVKIDRKDYDRYAAKFLMSYMIGIPSVMWDRRGID